MSKCKLKYRVARRCSAVFRMLLKLSGCAVLFTACTGLSRIQENQYLLTRNDLVLYEKSDIENFKKVRAQLREELAPKPNGKFLWMRPRLAIHNSVSTPKKEKGFKHWLKYKLGKAPVLLDETICDNLDLTFENRLFHLGHFNARSGHEIEHKKKTARVSYFVEAKAPYKIDTLILPEPDDSLSLAIRESIRANFDVKDEIYTLELLKTIRTSVENTLKDQGYFFFNKEFLLFLADTVYHEPRVKLKLIYKSDMPPEAGELFTIDRISIAEDFKLENYHPDTVRMGDYTIVSSSNYMKPKIYLNSVLTEKGELYSGTKHNNSLRQLMGLRSYKFVSARYVSSTTSKNKLDAYYNLTPTQKMSLSAEVNAVSKSNNFAGPGVILSFKSRNTMRGAELFSLNLRGRFEKQVTGEKKGDTAYEISADAVLDVPRLIPFKLRKINKPFVPQSAINLGGGLYSRVSLYRFNTFSTGLEYTWRRNEFLSHVLKPVDISVTNLADASEEFKQFLLLNPSIRQSFEEQFIIGLSYNFIINKLSEGNTSQYYINAGADPSGNLVALINALTPGKDDPDEKITVLGAPISQYFRFHTDLRYYFKAGKEARLATRFYTGIGIPYGNSRVMPYVKQFYAGGTNSLRAFRARSLGPGSYVPPDSLQNILVDQTGEIKLEANVEYRFPIIGFLKGALFTDIGNIWLANEDSLRPGGRFELEKFHKELAVGLGFGFRFDVDLVVLRIDLAFPVRKPWLPEDERWVFGEIDFFNRRWRKDNLLWNISIGYPF
ncbi:MAG: outer membrane protein assembly factor [Cytophagales bacterium]|nr:outer membrane protein assembly factor [Cytophagales bacterium]